MTNNTLARVRTHKLVLIIDLVESVRLMEAHEEALIMLWQRFVHHVQAVVLPLHRGVLVKSLGDGLLLVFDDADQAVDASLALHASLTQLNTLPEPVRLRAGLHATHLYVDALDVYGQGVNVAARIARQAQPGQTCMSEAVRTALRATRCACVRDLGLCHIEHVRQPVRLCSLQVPPT